MSTEIPTNFKIPRRYRRAFYFEETPTGFKSWIIVEVGKLMIMGRGTGSELANSRCLDWCAESIMQVRKELGV